ncbi:hypothetical protein FKW77_008043 [Venturia effusa]|uniref:Phosphatidate cytidylyltransferase n=1 Tax=Venturia effusa TaxID=50376 RepID=A0A517L5W5_9PEZI|nr:hypothetical protein FKW77_008043 [Venturia effusa]
MAKARKDVKFNHRGSGSGQRPRRLSNSISEHSETASDKGSPHRNASLEKVEESTPQSDFEKKKQTFITRTIWTLIMIAGFFLALFSGHLYVIIVVTVLQVVSFKEVVSIMNVPSRSRSLRFTKSLNWYFLGCAMYFLYGESVIYYFKHILLVDRILLPFATHHRFISFMLYIFGFVFFVGSLQKGHYKFQFTMFASTHIALYLIVVQAHFVMNNIFEGLIWFFLPAAMVITNDIWAYICGITFGRTQLIKLSPKKTVEGFLGAWFFTVLFGYLLTNIMTRYSYFICPVNDLGANLWTGLECDINPVFLKQRYFLPFIPATWSHLPASFMVSPLQFHIFFLASFASLVAPFGGFFASGIKRTFNIKDFGDSIPGHGGVTDRMDCQFIMGTLTYMYYQGFIATHKTSVGQVLEMAIAGLTPEQQVEVVRGLSKYLVNQGIITDTVLEYLNGNLPVKR